MRITLEWKRFLAKRKVSARLAAPLGMRPPYALAGDFAPAFGVSRAELDSKTVYMPQLKGVAELVLCPPSFDFPRTVRAGRRYVGVVDLSREEPAFVSDQLSADKPLVYCALGGQLYRAGDTPGFFRRVVQVFREHPEWQLLLALGKHMRADELGACPANVLVMDRAPQLAVLKRARAMITHGGLNSVKECVASGVPMLVFPLDVDQPGNAARVAYHGLGLRGDVAKTSADELRAMLSRVIDDPSFAARCKAMAKVWEAQRASSQAAALEVIEGVLR